MFLIMNMFIVFAKNLSISFISLYNYEYHRDIF